ncbi:hypothetical protein DFH08DRAFT_971261 [Mycena albidolilacea]|uniref:Uncharacterized protein n=1 Tax=Mycena albidolilacea TaxID=1033008 RepID=A0AAD6ZEB6_9AGAR|nr:hypothetical protein DFH08DRAFT_971261 [Mycena albidolilacea]
MYMPSHAVREAVVPADGSDNPIPIANAAVRNSPASAGSSVHPFNVHAVHPVHSFNLSNVQQPFAERHLFEMKLFDER